MACFFRVSKQVEVERVRANERESTALCNTALTVTSYRFCCALSTRSKAGGPVPTKARDCKKCEHQGSLESAQTSPYLSLSLVLLRKRLLDLSSGTSHLPPPSLPIPLPPFASSDISSSFAKWGEKMLIGKWIVVSLFCYLFERC